MKEIYWFSVALFLVWVMTGIFAGLGEPQAFWLMCEMGLGWPFEWLGYDICQKE